LVYTNSRRSTGAVATYSQAKETSYSVDSILDAVRRQEGTDPAALRFMEVLDHLHDDAVTIEDWKVLASRVQTQVPEDVPRFKDALRIYATREKVREYNFAKLRDLNRPVLKINALHHGPRAEHASTEDAGNLEATLLLSIGCRIMLLENLWTEHGLVNGAFGTVHEIVWQEGTVLPLLCW
jgi:hypothetical protein